MMLTDIEAATIFHQNCEVTQAGIELLERGLRAVIEANSASALADLKPAEKAEILDSFDAWELYRRDNKPQYYSADQVSALIQRNEALEVWLEGDATCPCCCQSVTCLDGCTFATDAPHDHNKMQEVRNILKATQ